MTNNRLIACVIASLVWVQHTHTHTQSVVSLVTKGGAKSSMSALGSWGDRIESVSSTFLPRSRWRVKWNLLQHSFHQVRIIWSVKLRAGWLVHLNGFNERKQRSLTASALSWVFLSGFFRSNLLVTIFHVGINLLKQVHSKLGPGSERNRQEKNGWMYLWRTAPAWEWPLKLRIHICGAPVVYGVARLQEIFEPRNTIYSLLMICPTDHAQK